MTAANLPAFALTVLVIAATPGPAVALILRRAGVHGWRAAVPTIAGLELGLFIWVVGVGLGLTVLITASQTAFLIWRVVGALFLIYLGIRAIRAGWRLRGMGEYDPLPAVRRSSHGAFGEGLLVQLANPKLAAFLFALYPQFLPSTGPTLSAAAWLGALQIVIETPLYLAFAGLVGALRAWFSQTRVRRRLDYVTGTILVALGVRVALSKA